MRKYKLRKFIAEYCVDNDECDADSLNMFLIDTSSNELKLKKLELKLKIEAELKQGELKQEQALKQTELKLKQEHELELRKAELK